MEDPDYNRRFHAAMAQAFSASNVAVRRAYLDLADFYREKLGERANMYPSGEVLRASCHHA